MKRRLALLALTAFASLVACQPPAAIAVRPGVRIRSCEYRLNLASEGMVRVEASCQADGAMSFRVTQPYLAAAVSGPMRNRAGSYAAPRGQLSYAIDLDRLARRGGDFDSAARIGQSFVAAMSSVLLVPEPLTTEIPVTVELTTAAGSSVAAGLASGSKPGSYRLMAHEIPVATYFAFGKLEQRRLELGGPALEIIKLDGKLDRSFDELSQWIRASAGAVRDFYGAFPVPRASVFVVPESGRDSVVFGKVLPESEPSIALVVGQHASRQKLYSDWILVHELFHLGFPSFFEEGKWLDEGLATYYEPIIRARAGLYSERELWSEFAKSLPQGLPAYTDYGLEQASDFRGVYWGGALACLEADVTARKRHVERGLEVGLRALREAGGTASEVWSLSDAISTVDQALGTPTLAPITERHAKRGSPFDLAQVLRDLGVRRNPDGSVQLSDAAPLAAVRRAITAKR